MKLEIEIPDEEIQEAIVKVVRENIQQLLYHWGTKDVIQSAVKRAWDDSTDDIIKSEIAKKDELEAMVKSEFTRQLRLKIAKLSKDEK